MGETYHSPLLMRHPFVNSQLGLFNREPWTLNHSTQVRIWLLLSGSFPDKTALVTHEVVTPRYRATSAPEYPNSLTANQDSTRRVSTHALCSRTEVHQWRFHGPYTRLLSTCSYKNNRALKACGSGSRPIHCRWRLNRWEKPLCPPNPCLLGVSCYENRYIVWSKKYRLPPF